MNGSRLLVVSLSLCALAPAQSLVANLKTTTGGQPSSGSDPFFVIGGLAVFDGNGAFGSEPYVTDGTSAGTHILKDLMRALAANCGRPMAHPLARCW